MRFSGKATQKLDNKSRPGIFIEYSDQSKAYRLLDTKTRKLIISMNVVIDEANRWTGPSRLRANHLVNSSEHIDVVVHPNRDCTLKDKATTKCHKQVSHGDETQSQGGEVEDPAQEPNITESPQSSPDNIEPIFGHSNRVRY